MIDIVFIIPEITKGMKSFGPKSLVPLRNGTLIEYQIELIRSIYKNNNIYLLTGFESEKIKKTIALSKNINKKNIHILEDKNYETHGQISSVFEYLNNKNSNSGAIFINNGIITKFNFQKSIELNNNSIFYIRGKKINFNIGSNNINSTEYLFYDLPFLWSECIYLNKETLNLVRDIILPHELKTLFFFELINKLLDQSILFQNIIIPKCQITKVNNIKDIKKLKTFV
jgi:hypothetical protein